MTSGIFDELLGQPEAIEQLQRAIASKAEGVHHAWLFTGPAGSGRSLLAKSFAAALQCEQNGCGNCQQCSLALADAHPDILTVATERVTISIDEVRSLVQKSQMSSTVGDYRIVIIEDSDRMTERTSNVLLKALEEPQEKTIWILCAPSVADLLPTIRSRARNVLLRLPSATEVAELLIKRDGIDKDLALKSARQAQNHVGMARRLAGSQDARARRAETLREISSITNLSRAMLAAEKLLGVAKRDAEALAKERDTAEKEHLMRAFGLAVDERIPPNLRPQFKDLEENQKRRNTRALRDGIDRIFTDAESFFRDVISLQLQANAELTNEDLIDELNLRVYGTTVDDNIAVLDAITEARKRLASNVRDLLVLESLCTRMILRQDVAA
ncbi:DNA polymerase III subunit delta' [Aquiluna sp.]|nr:DNA polymerase III subunit delta' [Aquiluna sp.]MDA8992669.1 DNA polymerase III subunit delta' [Aquiluna sp.]